MKRFGFLKTSQKAVFVCAVVLVTAVSVAATAVVVAAVSDNGGVIHGCYRSSGLLANGQLRVIDSSSESCNNNETAISWNQSIGNPEVSAYGHIGLDFGPPLEFYVDEANSYGIAEVTTLNEYEYCVKFEAGVTPTNVMLINAGGGEYANYYVAGHYGGENVAQNCGNDYHVYVDADFSTHGSKGSNP